MLAFTRKTEYALIAVCHLARCEKQSESARDIAGQYALAAPLLMNVLKLLSARGIVRSSRGAGGGYRLARRPEDVTVAQVIEAVEGPLRLVRCAPPLFGPAAEQCELTCSCPIRLPLYRVHHVVRSVLEQTSIAELAFDRTFDGHTVPEIGLKVLAQ